MEGESITQLVRCERMRLVLDVGMVEHMVSVGWRRVQDLLERHAARALWEPVRPTQCNVLLFLYHVCAVDQAAALS